jgi:hypothetical protein
MNVTLKFQSRLTTVDPTATPAAVEAICPNKPGPLCVLCGAATLLAGLAAGRFEREEKPPLGEERALDLPRGIFFNSQKKAEFISSTTTDVE